MRTLLVAAALAMAACGGTAVQGPAERSWNLDLRADCAACSGIVDAAGNGSVGCSLIADAETAPGVQVGVRKATVRFGDVVSVAVDGMADVSFTPSTKSETRIEGGAEGTIGTTALPKAWRVVLATE